jgi:hypothetical protein
MADADYIKPITKVQVDIETVRLLFKYFLGHDKTPFEHNMYCILYNILKESENG